MSSHNKEYRSRKIFGEYQTPHMIIWLMKHSGGLIKNQRQAANLLFFIIILGLVVAPYVVYLKLERYRQRMLTPREMERISNTAYPYPESSNPASVPPAR